MKVVENANLTEPFNFISGLKSFNMPCRKTPLQMGEQFCQLQESRVQTYVKLNDAHKKYLQTGPNYDFKEYQNEVANATEAFKTISSKVIFIQKELEGSDLEILIKQVCS